ncbi:MAG: M23 family metallopeptidase [Patescibacteria group bacterium]
MAILEALISIGRGLGFFILFMFGKPIMAISKLVFRYILVPLYSTYRLLKTKFSVRFAPAKNKIIYPLLNRSTIHVLIGVIIVGVIANNIFIKQTRAEEFGQGTIMATVTTNPDDVDITETAVTSTQKIPKHYQATSLASEEGQAVAGVGDGTDGGDTIAITSQANNAVIKPNIASTTQGERPRENVEYYTVEGGDTISTIAEKFGISTNTILWENRLGPRDLIKPGDKLTILPASGVSHQVKKGDTIVKIASRYSIPADTIVEYNKLANTDDIEQNEILIIPGGQMPEEISPSAPKSTSPSSGSSIFNIPPPSRVATSARLLWPTPSHKINQYYKGSRHTGVDIDGDYSSPIYAADNGRVEYANKDRSGYGLHIVINHGGGVKTLYGHESKLFVKVGDSVKRGQTIGMMGCTGRCTGTHLHFEVRINGAIVNPLIYL